MNLPMLTNNLPMRYHAHTGIDHAQMNLPMLTMNLPMPKLISSCSNQIDHAKKFRDEFAHANLINDFAWAKSCMGK